MRTNVKTENNAMQNWSNKMQLKVASGKDQKAIEMRYLGKSSEEIGAETGWTPAHVRRLFMTNGRLSKHYEQYVTTQQGLAQIKAATVLERAKQEAQEAIERMVLLSKDPSNGPVCFKANEYLLGIAGVSQEVTIKTALQKLSYEEALEKLNPLFLEVYDKPLIERPRYNISEETAREMLAEAKKNMEIYKRLRQEEPCQFCGKGGNSYYEGT